METLIISIAIGFAIGTALGMLGGGGSILTVPALVYIVGQTPQVAIATSLAIVGANSVTGAYLYQRYGYLNLRVAIVFGISGMVTAYAAAGIAQHFAPLMLMIAFAVLMLVVGVMMLLRRPPTRRQDDTYIMLKIISAGMGVGLLTGLLGVGGGFLIVPALVMLIGLPMQQAIGTSLVIIAMNSFAGFAGHIGTLDIDVPLVVVFVAAGMSGTLFGTFMAKRIPAERLRHLFAIFVMVLGLLLLVDNVSQL